MKTVLIADDSKLMRTKIKNLIEQEEYYVVAEAEDGEGAVKHYKDKKPDVVLLDLIMPNVDGIIALKKIVKINPSAKVIVFSSLASDYSVTNAKKYGAKEFVVKPHLEKLLPTLDRLN